MATKIKLMRLGKMREPHYRIVVADARTKRDGRAIEEIGKYHPTQEPSLIEVDSERAQYWLSVGAQPTEPVAAILKVTGDWQRFKGLPGQEGTLRVAEPKTDKKTIFEAAAKESAGEPKDGATTPKKRAAKKAAPAPEAAKTDDAKPAEVKADETPAAEAVEATPVEAPTAEAAPVETPEAAPAEATVTEETVTEEPKTEAPKDEA